jgi:uncharacterized membrane protein
MSFILMLLSIVAMVYRIDQEKRNSLMKRYLVKFLIQLIPGVLILSALIWLDNFGNNSFSTSNLIGFLLLLTVLLIFTFKNGLNKQFDYELIILTNRIESHIGKTIQYIHWNSVIIKVLENGDLVLEDKNISKRRRWNGIGKISVYSEFQDFDQLKAEIYEHIKS